MPNTPDLVAVNAGLSRTSPLLLALASTLSLIVKLKLGMPVTVILASEKTSWFESAKLRDGDVSFRSPPRFSGMIWSQLEECECFRLLPRGEK